MRELVGDDIIDERETHVYKPPAKPHPTVGRAGAPLRARRGKRDAAHFDTEERRERRDALVKQFERRGAQPCDGRFTQLPRVRPACERNLQPIIDDTRRARAANDRDLASEIRDARALAPREQGPRVGACLGQLLQDPPFFLADEGFHLGKGDSVWACGVQSESIDHESEGSASPAPEAIGEYPVAEPDVTKLTRRRRMCVLRNYYPRTHFL